MGAHADRDAALEAAMRHARTWLDSLHDRPVPAQATAEDMLAVFGGPLPEGSCDATGVIEFLGANAPPGLVAMGSGRFFGFVIGGAHPVALAADWLVSAWDQNAGLRKVTTANTALEETAAAWLLDLLGLPSNSGVGFVTGCTMANFTCLAAARGAVLRKLGWDEARDGLSGAPRVRVLVGAERHDTIDLALRYLGLGAPESVAADEQGRIDVAALEAALAANEAPTIVCLQAGNVHSGAFDDFSRAVAVAHRHGAWVHVDGAFGLWAAAAPALKPLVAGIDAADSWATDAHKTLNVPYDCGVAIVRDPGALRAAMGMHGDYLIMDAGGGDPYERVPELSRRARAIPVWAVLRCLGRRGAIALVERLCERARAFAEGVAAIPGARVLNDVVYTQVCLTFEDDERTRAIGQRLMDDGTAWISGSIWRGRAILRISVSNWSTSPGDVERALAALRHAAG
ncbi:MAG TPA: aminotransferase class V-fold PLP-dependent enzyme [Xanthomonadaceae bacterium]|jgi:glutamate/tyrosine decarboxylase-like PLP-dependent enzyme